MGLVLAAAGVAAALAAALAVPAAASPGAPQLAAGPGVLAWGAGSDGQLGYGGTTSQSSPVLVAGLPGPVAQVAAGGAVSAALLSDGTMWVWGCAASCPTLTPQQVPGLPAITQIAVSPDGRDIYAIASDGTLWAWGANEWGQLGNGTTTPDPRPAPVPGLTGITQVSAGAGYVLALTPDGSVWAWGVNNENELGGVTGNTEVPQQVPGVSRIIQVSASFGLSYAVTSDGTLYTWGNGIATPTFVQGVARIVQVASSGLSTLALTSDGHVFAWGDNSIGQLGDGTTTNQAYPEQIGLSGIIQVAIGWDNNSAAVRYDGTLWTWGDNSVAELGNGTCCAYSSVPVRVVVLAGVSQVATGNQYDLAIGSYNYTTVPSLTGDTTAQASQALQAAGLVIGTVNSAVDYSCNNIGTVMNQNPAAGSTVPVGSSVTITIGKRPPRPCT